MKGVIYLLAILILTSGCAAEYEKKGYWGEEGYSVTKIQADVFKITCRESGFASGNEVSDIALIRCADAARAEGFSYFVFIDRRSLVIQCFKEKPLDSSKIVYEVLKLSKSKDD
jgi:hypothetical protein